MLITQIPKYVESAESTYVESAESTATQPERTEASLPMLRPESTEASLDDDLVEMGISFAFHLVLLILAFVIYGICTEVRGPLSLATQGDFERDDKRARVFQLSDARLTRPFATCVSLAVNRWV